MSKKIRNEATDGLFHAILSLETMEECYTFFEDVCTINEIQSLSQRFEVAKLLQIHTISFHEYSPSKDNKRKHQHKDRNYTLEKARE